MSALNNAVNLTDSASVDFDFPAPGTPGYEDFRKSGKLPSSEESAPPEKDPAEKLSEELDAAEAAEIAAADVKPAVTRPASATGKPQGKKKTGDERIQELANQNRELRERLEAVERRPAEPAREAAASQPAAEKKEALKSRPKWTDNDPKTGKPFETLDAWSEAVEKWDDARLNGILEERLTKENQTRTQAEQERTLATEAYRRAQPAMKKYADFDEVVTNNDKLLTPKGSVAFMFLMNPNTKDPGELSYYLGKHPEILESFYDFDSKTGKFTNKIDPVTQLITLTALDLELSGTQQPAPRPPARVPSQAPRPAHQVSGKAPTADPLAKAVEEGDQAEFTRLENEKLLAKRKASGRR